MIKRKTCKTLNEAVDAATTICGEQNFEIRSNGDGTFDLIYDQPEEEKR